jgi:hypothetical protein
MLQDFPLTPVTPRSALEGLVEGVRLSAMARQGISPVEVAAVLADAQVPYVLVGGHAVNAHSGRPRATVDVDILTTAEAKARKSLHAAFPDLIMRDSPVVLRFMRGDEEAIDLMKARNNPLFRRVMHLGMEVQMQGTTVRVATVEAMLAMKFAAMGWTGRRTEDRMQDAADFIRVWRANDPVNIDVVHELGELVYKGGGEAIIHHINDARAGRVLEI